MIGEPAAFLQDGMNVTMQAFEGEPISASPARSGGGNSG